jgi:hypothetical protein
MQRRSGLSSASGRRVPGVQGICKLFACYATPRFKLCCKSGTAPCDALATLLLCRLYGGVLKGLGAVHSLTQEHHVGVGHAWWLTGNLCIYGR